MKTLIGNNTVEAVIRFHCPDLDIPPEDIIDRIGRTTLSVLITGESGTGKELLARSIHLHSTLRQGPFVAIDCGALVSGLVESELFGYRKGAFTGAVISKVGLMACAGGGTIFLDEIGELPIELQPKLLRVLQEHEVRPLGDTQPIPIRARIIAATNKDLEGMVREGKFREDLFYRLGVVTLNLPPLRHHTVDIAASCEVILNEFQRDTQTRHTVSEEALVLMREYDWPGNLRELENCLRRIAAFKPDDKIIRPEDLPPRVRIGAECNRMSSRGGKESLYELEKNALLKALDSVHGDKVQAAKMLGIGKTTLYRKLKEYQAGELRKTS